MQMIAAVIGAGSFGTAIARHIATVRGERPIREVFLVCRGRDRARAISLTSRNPDYLSDVELPPEVTAVSFDMDADAALAGADRLVLAVPTRHVRASLDRVSSAVGSGSGIGVLGLAKGIEPETGKFVRQIVSDVLPDARYTALSGPSHAEELSHDVPTAVVAASEREEEAVWWQSALSDDRLRVYTSTDVIGTEAGGAMKNVAAIASGIARASGFGDNSIAALATRALAEMTRIAAALGADPATMAGLAGVGDLMVTCWSDLSRNFRFGEAIGRGMSAEEAERSVGQAVEGKYTVRQLTAMARSLGVDAPVADAVEAIVFGGESVRSVLPRLLARDPKPEMRRR